ncbi:hypothetical protein GGP41_005721 [Bipolaris sorokiniana]|uniref:Uncharacterized protein n=1 Tax=Cochliobolus sativus TaxID=45130 RepID=A0A8H5ZDL6_COCSA|nr:hypothetical protein GGP41_005721 [Bipolaris sorokiniana]
MPHTQYVVLWLCIRARCPFYSLCTEAHVKGLSNPNLDALVLLLLLQSSCFEIYRKLTEAGSNLRPILRTHKHIFSLNFCGQQISPSLNSIHRRYDCGVKVIPCWKVWRVLTKAECQKNKLTRKLEMAPKMKNVRLRTRAECQRTSIALFPKTYPLHPVRYSHTRQDRGCIFAIAFGFSFEPQQLGCMTRMHLGLTCMHLGSPHSLAPGTILKAENYPGGDAAPTRSATCGEICPDQIAPEPYFYRA